MLPRLSGLTKNDTLSSLAVMRSDQMTYRRVTSDRRYLQVALQLLEGIGSGATPLGSRLPSDRDLATMMGVSRPTVREAVLALEVVGVLQVRSGDGTYVTHDGSRSSKLGGLGADKKLSVPPSEVLEARAAVEPAAAGLVAQRASPEQIIELEHLLDRASAMSERVENLGEFVRLGLQFHSGLARLCGNAHIGTFLDALVAVEEHPLWTLLNAHAMQNTDSRRAQVAEHEQILDAIRGHDAAGASALMSEHLGHLARAIDSLNRSPLPDSPPGRERRRD